MRALILLEDPTLDQYIVRPVVERIFSDLGVTATVEVLRDPHLSGAKQALDKDIVAGVVADNRMVDLFVLVVDRDCDRQLHSTKAAARRAEHPGKLVAALAWQEVEVWALALHRAELPASWAAVRAECDPKEAYFEPFVREKGLVVALGRGRKRLMRDLGRSWSGLLQVCPEIAELRDTIRAWSSRDA